MLSFTSRRERTLWIACGAVVVAIYLTLGMANSLAEALGNSGLFDLLWVVGLILMTAVVGFLVLGKNPGTLQIVVLIGIAVAYGMVMVRMSSPVERSHVFEYSLVGVLIYLALVERQDNGRRVRSPWLMAVVATALIGWVDELIQWLMPNRVYDIRDVGFNALAGFMAASAAAVLRWTRQRSASHGVEG